MEKSKTSRVFLISPVLAGLLGFVVAILFAPRSGKQTREMLIKKAEGVKKQTHDSLSNAKRTLNKNASDARDFKNQLMSTWKNTNHSSEKKGDQSVTDEHTKQSVPERNSVLSTWEEEG